MNNCKGLPLCILSQWLFKYVSDAPSGAEMKDGPVVKALEWDLEC